MQCPVCQVDLLLSERQGIEVDYCPKCRGIWLDRGELDKLIERAQSSSAPVYAQESRGREERPHYPPQPEYRGEHPRSGDPHRRHKRKSFLEEIFDFD